MSCATISFQTRESGRSCRHGRQTPAPWPHVQRCDTHPLPLKRSASTKSWTRSQPSIAVTAPGRWATGGRAHRRRPATSCPCDRGGARVRCRIHPEQAACRQGQPGSLRGNGDARLRKRIHPHGHPDMIRSPAGVRRGSTGFDGPLQSGSVVDTAISKTRNGSLKNFTSPLEHQSARYKSIIADRLLRDRPVKADIGETSE